MLVYEEDMEELEKKKQGKAEEDPKALKHEAYRNKYIRNLRRAGVEIEEVSTGKVQKFLQEKDNLYKKIAP